MPVEVKPNRQLSDDDMREFLGTTTHLRMVRNRQSIIPSYHSDENIFRIKELVDEYLNETSSDLFHTKIRPSCVDVLCLSSADAVAVKIKFHGPESYETGWL